MNIRSNKSNRLAAACFISTAVFVLNACNEGGGGDVSLNGVRIPTQRLEINASNGEQIIGESGDANDRKDDAMAKGSNPQNTSNTAQSQNMAAGSLISLKQLSMNAPKHVNISPLATSSCPLGGTMTTPDSTDRMGDYVYDNCQGIGGVVYDGTISVQGTVDRINNYYDVSYTYERFAITWNGVSIIYDGEIDLEYSDDGIVSDGRYQIPSLTIVWGEHGARFSDYFINFHTDRSANEGYLDFAYTFSSTLLKGSVHAESTERLFYYLDADNPYDGKIVWTGAKGTSVRLTVLPNGTGDPGDPVLVEFDADGDGDYEEYRETTWGDLN